MQKYRFDKVGYEKASFRIELGKKDVTFKIIFCDFIILLLGCTSWFSSTIIHKTTKSVRLIGCRECKTIESIFIWKAVNVQYSSNFDDFKGFWIDVTEQALRVLRYDNHYLVSFENLKFCFTERMCLFKY